MWESYPDRNHKKDDKATEVVLGLRRASKFTGIQGKSWGRSILGILRAQSSSVITLMFAASVSNLLKANHSTTNNFKWDHFLSKVWSRLVLVKKKIFYCNFLSLFSFSFHFLFNLSEDTCFTFIYMLKGFLCGDLIFINYINIRN